MEVNKIVICPMGWAVDLGDIRSVGPVESQENTHYTFVLNHKFVDKKHVFWYKIDDYSDSPEELLVKIQNIRYEVIKLMNGGRDVKPISGIINLNKNNG